jgi:hypothetical protein
VLSIISEGTSMAVDGKKVVVFTPFGRELTVSILYKYLKRDHERGIVDEWQLWMNTDTEDQVVVKNGQIEMLNAQVSDTKYGYKLAKENDWITVHERQWEPKYPKQLNTGMFYQFAAQDPDAVYIRFDDDMVYIHEDAITNLVRSRMLNNDSFVVFPIIWNNAVVTHHLQQMGIVPKDWGEVEPYCMDKNGWADPEFAEKMHNLLLSAIEAGVVDKLYFHHDRQLPLGQQFSVSCFAIDGKIYSAYHLREHEEEDWHTVYMPRRTGVYNKICSNAVVSHFSFFHQRDHLLNNTDILQRYKKLADKL